MWKLCNGGLAAWSPGYQSISCSGYNGLMELLIRLIEWLIHTLVNENERRRSAAPPEPSPSMPPSVRAQVQQRAQTSVAALAQRAQRPTQPLVTSTKAASQDPLYDDRGWRSAITTLAVAVLLVMVLLWAVYVMK